MHSLTPNNLTTTMVCLAVLGVVPPHLHHERHDDPSSSVPSSSSWTEAFFARAAELMPSFRPMELANMLTAAGEMTKRAFQAHSLVSLFYSTIHPQATFPSSPARRR